MKAVSLCFFLLAITFLTACSSGQTAENRKLSVTAVSTIRNGITTKQQVFELLGNPQSTIKQLPIQQPPGAPPLPTKYLASEIWGYWNTENKSSSFSLPFMSSKAPKQKRYSVIVYLDEQGVVLDCETETSEI